MQEIRDAILRLSARTSATILALLTLSLPCWGSLAEASDQLTRLEKDALETWKEFRARVEEQSDLVGGQVCFKRQEYVLDTEQLPISFKWEDWAVPIADVLSKRGQLLKHLDMDRDQARAFLEGSSPGPGDSSCYTIRVDLSVVSREVTIARASAANRALIRKEKIFGGDGNSHVRSIAAFPGGGTIIAGFTEVPLGRSNEGHRDTWVVRFSSKGTEVWDQRFPQKNFRTWADSVSVFPNGTMIVVGLADGGVGGKDNSWMMKLSSSGKVMWQENFRGTDGIDLGAESVATLKDESFVVCGDSWVIKFDKDGRKVWHTDYSFFRGISFQYVNVLPGGGFIVAGDKDVSRGNERNEDGFVIRLSASGERIWSRVYGGDKVDTIKYITHLPDGGFAFIGDTYSYSRGAMDIWFVRLDSDGGEVWTRTAGGSQYDFGRHVVPTQDGGFLLTGSTYSKLPENNGGWLIKLSSNGSQVWERTFDGTLREGRCAHAVERDGLVIAGSTPRYGNNESAVRVIRLDSRGSVLW